MASTEDKKDIPENEENNENPEEQKEEEEEPVDLELQKEMKGIKIVDSDFSNEPKSKKQNKKLRNPEDKKNKKKGQDFLDYANKNNIQFNIEYEENKYQLKKKDEQKNGDKNGNNKYNNNNKRQYNKGGYNKNYQQKGNRNTGNKFDNINQRMYPPQQHYYQNYFPKLVENKEILDYLEKIFGEKNLNKDTYIRNRLKDGKILVDDIASYNNIKKNNIDSKKIMEIVKDSQNLECVNEEDKDYIKIKNFDKLNLLSIEQIISNKAMMRMRNYANPIPPYGYNPYINMQNNYYFSFPSYNPSEGYIPPPENK